ncbi:hypothetical protein A2697_04605 [Candidatus Curtissbacteria bacterium RIFCSPHIGHO2_01_FULL_41_44]|uniref:Transcription elongation factor GreA/GreB N-terminal domain-containing protein n=1 Tax=Candidatus Curtissbacteria bacterium RIFCSPLOWO2_01_FULL_42_50 TaxID=1797730 RepID=A0A1F5H2L5_9BACT|nr:MAG: hypothetical protein A3C33_01715 [Candidatus Curtissbacteria bacterium RIFCSPHIGHO2_02_FULL_42_58]OGD94775.1 MAG: hypothetical protein A2697_04605 [Candidatus Curtissbacteria bacterium RIFCSPHIGHO2_01_FULL_41_44]OGD96319.1 MAG: hypothetical protein A3E71_02070 [Candidatus Curtissbacteria bacterium RIFCSPHIGHO2_12_FULL_42_33]OGD98338.1 MAG: hypothetical protein A3B54_00585 [Candidatus Curtissbacteria bacterium RIFCSPLOWO2_01_FULL_42_50]OGE02975.1 MAG: hypothetical protein A3G16_04575 [Ca
MREIQTKAQKLRDLKKRLKELEEVKLKEALAKYGQAYQESTSNWNENAAWELADEEVSVLRAMITGIKTEIKNLKHPPSPAPTNDPPSGENSK